ncbi:MAG: hypothetical protein V2A73_03510, partial [Pseudomonadota bacterium]
MVGVHCLAAAEGMDGEGIGAGPPGDAGDEVALAEVDEADFFVGFFAGEASGLGGEVVEVPKLRNGGGTV